MRAGSTLLAAGLMLLGAGGAMAQSQEPRLTICNRDPDRGTYIIASLERWPFLFAERWEASGWYRLEPNACRTWSRGNVNTLFLLSIAEVGEGGRRVLDYGVDAVPDWHWNTASYGVEAFFCVSDQPFSRRADEEAAFTRCQGDEYLQLFNVHVFVEHDDHYTLNLQ